MNVCHEFSGEEREFQRRVSRAIYANPFSDERVKADLEISGLPSTVSDSERLHGVIRTVSAFMTELQGKGVDHLEIVSAADRELFRNMLLFVAFHRYIESFDRLIQKQVDSSGKSCAVPFAGEMIQWLTDRGFPRADALFYLALFYQMRRAFFFINTGLIGRSNCMKELRRNLWNNVFTADIGFYADHMWSRMEDFSTLLYGETGTGKGSAAAAIGRSGFIPFDERTGCFAENFMDVFISLNLSQYSESLIESELFGHRKGAFTGAIESHSGIFSRCSTHGSIFLDEIGEVAIPVQIKLLQVLQDRTYSPVGSHEKLRFHGRVIAATNQSLPLLRAQGRFRNDFFYRLCSDILTVPPLRQRIDEYPGERDDLIAHCVQRILGKPAGTVADTLIELIRRQPGPRYPWPGNVRELEQCIRRLLLNRQYWGDSGDMEETDHFCIRLKTGSLTARELLAGYCSRLYIRWGTYEEVSRRTGLDRRTVKRYVQSALNSGTPAE